MPYSNIHVTLVGERHCCCMSEVRTITIYHTVTEHRTTIVRDSLLAETPAVAQTIQHNTTDAGTSFQPCADPSPTIIPTSAFDSLQAGNTSFGVGFIIAVVLGVILLVQLIACTVAWVVCLKGKQRRMKREGRGTGLGVESVFGVY